MKVEEHRGIIIMVVANWWPKLPAYVKPSYSMDDMVSDTVLHVVRKSHLYDEHSGRVSTWLHTVVRNYCYQIIEKSCQHSRYHYRVDLEDYRVPETNVEGVQVLQARDGVERVIQQASPQLKVYLAKNIFGERGTVKLNVRERRSIHEELLSICHRLSVTEQDFRMVLTFS